MNGPIARDKARNIERWKHPFPPYFEVRWTSTKIVRLRPPLISTEISFSAQKFKGTNKSAISNESFMT